MTRQRVVVWGGSGVATPELVHQIVQMAPAGSQWEAVLWGRNREQLDLVVRLSQSIAKAGQADVHVWGTTNLDEANQGAHWVLNQIRVGGLPARHQDESLPQMFGTFGEETVGLGGFGNALRTIPVVLDLCTRLKGVAPGAVILNLTNPSSMVQYAIRRYTRLPVVGTCDSPVSLMESVARILGVPAAEITFWHAGMHHFGWILRAEHRGVDRLAEVLPRSAEIPKLDVDPQIIQAIGAIPSPYFKYYFHPDRMLAKGEGRPTRAQELMAIQSAMLAEYAAWRGGPLPKSLIRRGAAWYRKIVVPVLLALAGTSPRRYVVSWDNEGVLPWLPNDAIVELPAMIASGTVHLQDPGPIPKDIIGMIQGNCAYEQIAVEAIVERSYDKALRALMMNWAVSNMGQARGYLAAVWPNGPSRLWRLEMPGEACQRPILEFPTIHYGYDLLEHIPMGDERIGVVTMEEPWELARPRFPRVPDAILFLRSMDWDTVEAAERALPVVDRVVGLGGGTSIDMAKYIGWRRHIPVDAIPSISSVDAGMTKSIAVRESGHVQYIGFVVPKNVYVDYGLIQAAPAALNRAGVGDIVSIHTALWDWAYARDEHGARYDEPTAHEVRAWLQAISDQAADIRAVSKEGIKLIFAAFAAVNKACRAFGSSQPQEGSEHTFAYNAEYVTRRTFIHGEIVSLGTLIMSMLQENDPHIVQDILERCGVRYQPRDLGLSRSEVEKILSTLNEYQKSFGRRPTVLDGRAIDDAFIRRVLNSLVFAS